MDNVLKFLIKLNADKGNVVSVARETERQLDSINRKASVVGRGLRKAFSFDGFKGALMSIPGMQFLMNPYTMIGAGVGAMVRLGAQAESVNVAFTTLVGSESKAAQMLGQINDFAAHSPFGKMDLTQSAQTMLNFGVETGKVLPLLRQLGDISGGDKDKMSALSLVMGQVSSTGYLMGQDLLQFINAGFNPIQELSQMTGISVDKLKDKMAKGQITYRNVEQAIAHATDAGGKFNGMMDKQSQTLSGKFSTLMDIVKQGAIDLSQSVNTPIAEVVEKITAAIPKVFAVFQAVFSAISAGIGFVVRFRTAFMILGGAGGVGRLPHLHNGPGGLPGHHHAGNGRYEDMDGSAVAAQRGHDGQPHRAHRRRRGRAHSRHRLLLDKVCGVPRISHHHVGRVAQVRRAH